MVKLTCLLLFAAPLVHSAPAQGGRTIAGFGNIHWPKGRPLPVKITKSLSGQLIGWVKREAQNGGRIAAHPPPTNFKRVKGRHFPESELAHPEIEKGPAGTVPFQLLTVEEFRKIPSKSSPPHPRSRNKKRQISSNGHYYGNSGQSVNNYGGSAYLSLFQPAIASSGSMSLIQTAITNGNQTAELGWQVLPSLHDGSVQAYIFTYYTTNGYADGSGCYNALCDGYVQVSDTYAPGLTFSTISSVGGNQYETPIEYYFYEGNWWISVNNEWMGYYPGSIYARNGDTTNTLGSGSNYLLFYGETYDDPSSVPCSDMGSGQFADTGFGNAGYMHNIQYLNSDGSGNDYNGATGQSDADWFTIEPRFQSGESWASYLFVGGPGAC